jgi:RHS repeat-associated protein
MNGGAVTIVYDGDGNRVSKTANGVTTQYLVDDMNPTGYPQVVEELVSGAVTRQYTYGMQRVSQNQLISNAWTVSFYGYDGGGNVRNLTNSAGAVTDEYEYDAFGNAFTKVGSTPNVYLYRGEQYDPDLGLYYLRARYYNPSTGRFLSRDPNAGEPTDPASLHKYLYAGGDPVNRIDPRGREDQVEYSLTFIPGGTIAATAVPYLVELATAAGPSLVAFGAAIAPGIAAAKAFCWAESALAWAFTKAGIKTEVPEPEAGLCILLGP